jgi:dynein heavy chain
LDTIKSKLHLVLCMSPAGDQLRMRCRDFPGLISSVIIDWYFSWPEAALLAVAEYALDDTKLPEDHRANIYKHMVKVHYGIAAYSEEFLLKLKRRNYSTPKNYLDFLNNYKKFMQQFDKKFAGMILRFEDGLEKLNIAKNEVQIL